MRANIHQHIMLMSQSTWSMIAQALMVCHTLLKPFMLVLTFRQLHVSHARIILMHIMGSLVRVAAGTNGMAHPFYACKPVYGASHTGMQL